MGYDCTGVILAGGKNLRLPGIKKSFHEIQGTRIMDSIYELFRSLFDEIIIVANEPEAFADWDALIVSDIDPSRCSICGVHAALFYATHPHVFISACDTPFLKRGLAEYILGQVKPGYDVVMPETEGGLEPLCAVYSRDCLPRVEQSIREKRFMIKKAFKKNRIRILPKDVLKRYDPDMRSFFNINTPTDLETARSMVGQGPDGKA